MQKQLSIDSEGLDYNVSVKEIIDGIKGRCINI
jgi:hypothetical protein